MRERLTNPRTCHGLQVCNFFGCRKRVDASAAYSNLEVRWEPMPIPHVIAPLNSFDSSRPYCFNRTRHGPAPSNQPEDVSRSGIEFAGYITSKIAKRIRKLAETETSTRSGKLPPIYLRCQ